MKSRFAVTFFLAVLCVFAPLRDIQAQPKSEIRGLWIHTYSAFDWDTEMKKLADAGFNCVFARVSRGVSSIYPSQFLARDDWAQDQPQDELQKAIAAAHRNGLEFHAWRVCFNSNGAAKQKGAAKTLYDRMEKDDRLVRGLDGKQSPFLNPADPRNQQLELNALREITQKYDVDGIHLDYIRYPDVPHFDFDYGAVSRAEFEKFSKRKVANWPEDVYSGAQKWDYENWERNNINNLVRQVYAQTKKLKPRVQVSAAVWRDHRSNRAFIKQDWVLWAKNGWLDFAVPMDYGTDEARFRSDINSQVANSAGRVLLAAGIGNFQHKTVEMTLKQIEIAREEGADGYVLFDYKPEKYEALLAQLKTQARSTLLPFRAPKIEWKIDKGIERKDDALAFAVGSSMEVRTKSILCGIYPQPMILYELCLESLDGKAAPTTPLAYSDTPNMLELTEIIVPSGRWHIVVHSADFDLNTKRAWNIKIRGPIIEGLPPEKIAELRAREKPPIIEGDGKRVAIYANALAESGLLRALKLAPNMNAYSIYQLKPEHYREAEVLLLPQLRDVAELSPQAIQDLRDWVSRGGVLLLTHEAVGFRAHLRVFSEIGQGVAFSKTREVEVLENTFGFATGKWQHEYSDHITIAPGADGKIIARDTDGAPILVGGNFGKGKVFLYGGLLGYAPDGVLDAGETQLLLDLTKN